MKKITFLFFALLFTLGVSAQEVPFNKGTVAINAGFGLGSAIYSGNFKTVIPPVSISGEYGIVGGLINGRASVGVGGYLGFTTASYTYSYASLSYKESYTSIIPGARGAFHYSPVSNLDLYAGLMLGYNIVSYTTDAPSNNGYVYTRKLSSFAHSEFIGARYFFTDSFGAFAELGSGVAYANLGVSFKF